MTEITARLARYRRRTRIVDYALSVLAIMAVIGAFCHGWRIL